MADQANRAQLLVAKSYGGHLVLKNVDFTIGANEIVAVIGENGAGKSTFAKILAGAVQPESALY